MAIDSPDKRACALCSGILWRVVLPAPDGTIGPGDKLQVMALYRGIAAALTEPPPSEASPQQPMGRMIEVAGPVGRLIE